MTDITEKDQLEFIEAEIRADERLKVIAEVSIELNKYHKDICNANYPFNFIDMALDNVRHKVVAD